MRTIVPLLAFLLLGGAPGLPAQEPAPGQPPPHPYRLRFEPSEGGGIAREDVRRIVERAIENRFRQPVEVAEGAEPPAYMDVRVIRPPEGGYAVSVACIGGDDGGEEPVRGTATGTEPVSVLGLGAVLAMMVHDETIACRIPAGAAAREDAGPGHGLAEALRVADPELVTASSVPGRLELRYRDGVVARIPTDSVTLAVDHNERWLELRCHAPLCIRPAGQSFADGVVWSFPMDGPGGDDARRAYRRARSGLAALVPPGAVRTDTTAAPPAPELVALAALPPARWTLLQPPDTMLADVAVERGGAWVRLRYPAPRLGDGGPYDTVYMHYEVDCAATRIRLTRIAYSHDHVIVRDSAVQGDAEEARPGTRGRGVLDRVCGAGG